MAVYAKPRDISAPKVRNGLNDWYDGYIELGGELVRSTAIDGMAEHLFHVYNTAGIYYEAVDPLHYTNMKLDPNYWELSAWGRDNEWSGYAMINATRNYEDHTYTNPDNGYKQGGIVSHWEVQGRDVDGYAFNFIQLRPLGIDFYLDYTVGAELTIRNIPVGTGTHILVQDADHKVHKVTTASVIGNAGQNGGNFIWNQNAEVQTGAKFRVERGEFNTAYQEQGWAVYSKTDRGQNILLQDNGTEWVLGANYRDLNINSSTGHLSLSVPSNKAVYIQNVVIDRKDTYDARLTINAQYDNAFLYYNTNAGTTRAYEKVTSTGQMYRAANVQYFTKLDGTVIASMGADHALDVTGTGRFSNHVYSSLFATGTGANTDIVISERYISFAGAGAQPFIRHNTGNNRLEISNAQYDNGVFILSFNNYMVLSSAMDGKLRIGDNVNGDTFTVYTHSDRTYTVDVNGTGQFRSVWDGTVNPQLRVAGSVVAAIDIISESNSTTWRFETGYSGNGLNLYGGSHLTKFIYNGSIYNAALDAGPTTKLVISTNGVLGIADMPTSVNAGDFIQNQLSSAQNAQFWISGNAYIGGQMLVDSISTYGNPAKDSIEINIGGRYLKVSGGNGSSKLFDVQYQTGYSMFSVSNLGNTVLNNAGSGLTLDVNGTSGFRGATEVVYENPSLIIRQASNSDYTSANLRLASGPATDGASYFSVGSGKNSGIKMNYLSSADATPIHLNIQGQLKMKVTSTGVMIGDSLDSYFAAAAYTLDVNGTLAVTNIPNATVDPDKLMVHDGVQVKYMTKAQLGIGGGTLNQYQVGVGSASNTLSGSNYLTWDGNTFNLQHPAGGDITLQGTTSTAFTVKANGNVLKLYSAQGILLNDDGVGKVLVGYTTSQLDALLQVNGHAFIGQKLLIANADQGNYYLQTPNFVAIHGGMSNYIVGRTYFGDNSASRGNFKVQVDGNMHIGNNMRLEVDGDVYTHRTVTPSGGGAQTLISQGIFTLNAPVQSAGSVWSPTALLYDAKLNGGAWSMSAAAIHSSNYIQLRLLSETAATVSVEQSGKRAMTANGIQIHLPQAVSGTTISHLAGLQIYSLYQDNGTTESVAVTNYYAVLIGNTHEHMRVAGKVTNRWAIYQEGPNDLNEWFGKHLYHEDGEYEAGNGPVVVDDVTGIKYRIRISNGAFAMTQVS